MAFVAICPDCEHTETRPLASFEPLCPECSAGWLAWTMHFLDHHYFGRFGNEFLK